MAQRVEEKNRAACLDEEGVVAADLILSTASFLSEDVYVDLDSTDLCHVAILEHGVHKDNGIYCRIGGIPACPPKPKLVEVSLSAACLQQ